MFEDNVVMCHLGIKALSQENPFDISLFNELILKHVFHVNEQEKHTFVIWSEIAKIISMSLMQYEVK